MKAFASLFCLVGAVNMANAVQVEGVGQPITPVENSFGRKSMEMTPNVFSNMVKSQVAPTQLSSLPTDLPCQYWY